MVSTSHVCENITACYIMIVHKHVKYYDHVLTVQIYCHIADAYYSKQM